MLLAAAVSKHSGNCRRQELCVKRFVMAGLVHDFSPQHLCWPRAPSSQAHLPNAQLESLSSSPTQATASASMYVQTELENNTLTNCVPHFQTQPDG